MVLEPSGRAVRVRCMALYEVSRHQMAPRQATPKMVEVAWLRRRVSARPPPRLVSWASMITPRPDVERLALSILASDSSTKVSMPRIARHMRDELKLSASGSAYH